MFSSQKAERIDSREKLRSVRCLRAEPGYRPCLANLPHRELVRHCLPQPTGCVGRISQLLLDVSVIPRAETTSEGRKSQAGVRA
jgi:hypothetical protein